MRVKPTKFMSVFATTVGGIYPVRLCLHILPDAFWHVVAGSWSVSLAMLGCVRFFLNVFKHAGFRSESCGIGSLCKVVEFPTMNATAMTILAIPSAGIGSLLRSVPEPSEASLYFPIKACFYPTEVLSAAISTQFPRS